VELVLNEGQAIHSVYNPKSFTTGGPWDYFLIAGSFRPTQSTEPPTRSVAILGLAGGTAARQYREAFGDRVALTGVEIDPDILDAGRRYFHLDESGVRAVVQDARYWLASSPGQYDVIIMDAYRQPYIPFHLTTTEFFQLVRQHLKPGGVAVVNAGRTASDYRLVAALSSTVAASGYDQVFLVDTPRFSNTIIYATTQSTSLGDVRANLERSQEALVREVAATAESSGNLRLSEYHGQVFTDDLAPVERLIDSIIFGYIAGPGRGG
jgi:spermidine synthase